MPFSLENLSKFLPDVILKDINPYGTLDLRNRINQIVSVPEGMIQKYWALYLRICIVYLESESFFNIFIDDYDDYNAVRPGQNDKDQ